MKAGSPVGRTTPAVPIDRQETSADGLSSQEAARRLVRDGLNAVPQPRRLLLHELLRRLSNPLVAILLIAAAFAGATGDPASFSIILVVVMLSTVLDMVQAHRAEATAAALRRSIAIEARVLRDGRAIEVPVTEIVTGDVVHVAAGDLVPADAIIIAANHLQVNEAVLTGEPYPVEKMAGPSPSVARNALFQGTSVIGGSGTALVVATGMRTRFGAIAAALAAAPAPTAFERDLHRFGGLILRLTVFLALFVLLANIMLRRPPLDSFLFATALAVGLTPELLPMIVTVALAHGAKRMAAARVIVKRLSAIHDLGEMDILCTDKTGTLTEAHISLVGHPGAEGAESARVLELAAVNAMFETGLKSPLDEALLACGDRAALGRWRKIDERPFDFERRRVSVLAEAGGERIEIVKGAPETLLALAKRVDQADGGTAPIDPARRATLQAMHDDGAAQGRRLLAVAWKPAPNRDRIASDDDTDLVFAGYCLFEDPPKSSAAAAIGRLAAAHVRLKIVSGDAAPVVEHLVGALGIAARGTLTGERIAALSDAALAACVDETDIFARVTPDQKTRIVNALIARGHTVGFLGDGINDAPAIRAADVGLSVDGATDVAREAADMILLAPDLGVLAAGIEEGRQTHANMMKYVRMGTSSNFGNMVTMALASLVLPFLPLTAVQVLLNNLIYDLSQLGIPLDRADPADIAVPHGWNMHALVRFTAIMGLVSSLFDFLAFAILRLGFHAGEASFRAGWFLESMATQILVVFVIRTTLPAWRSRPARTLVASASAGLLAALALSLLPVRTIFGFGSLPLDALLALAGLVLGYLGACEILKGFAIAPVKTRGRSAA